MTGRYPCHEVHSRLCVCVGGGGGGGGWLAAVHTDCLSLILMGDFPTIGSCDFCISVYTCTHIVQYNIHACTWYATLTPDILYYNDPCYLS